MTGPLNWYKDGAQRGIDESTSHPFVPLSPSPRLLTTCSETFPGLPPTLPVLLIYGKYDPTCLEYSLKLMKYLASVGVINARFEEVEAWHWLTYEKTDEVNKFTLEFFKEVLV